MMKDHHHQPSNNIVIDEVVLTKEGGGYDNVLQQQHSILSVATKAVFIAIIAIIQLVVIYVKIQHEATFIWAVCFIPSWILFAVWLIYWILNFRYAYPQLVYKSSNSSTGKRRFKECFSATWTGFFWLTLFIFLIVLSTQLDQGAVDYPTLVILWIAYFVFLLIVLILYAIFNYCSECC